MSSNDHKADGQNSVEASAFGAYSLAEILSQPQCWADCLVELERNGKIADIRERFGHGSEWLFVGCGTSYYIALAAAASWSALTGIRARGIPASELLLFPELTLAGSSNFVPVLISRSGRTSEVLEAAELLSARKVSTLAISCAAGQSLERLASTAIVLPAADEQSTVMTRSFTSMLLGLQYLAASVAGNKEFLQSLRELPNEAREVLRKLPGRIREFIGRKRFADYVCLGQGPYYGLACESTLKLTEMSCSYAQCFHTLEFRHGPKSIAGPETLVSFLISESNYEAELEVLEEIKELGATTLAVVNKADARARAAADFLVELNLDLPEFARLTPYVFFGQLMGLYTGLQKGLDPDKPRHLSRVVILEEGEEDPQHAAI